MLKIEFTDLRAVPFACPAGNSHGVGPTGGPTTVTA
jgi:hypothetical protein